MPSRNVFPIINTKKTVEPEDVNIIYRLLNGDYDTNKGHGMSVQLTAFDGRMSTGLIDTAKYALEVRNRELTQQRTAAFRRADNKIVAAIEGGLLYAVKDTGGATTPTQVMVYGTSAGGVLGGTYPNPTFATLTEYYRVYPTMCVLWYGSSSTTFVSPNNEVTDAPGWVFCDGSSVTLRSGTVITTPNMANRIPIGVGTVTKGTDAGVSFTSLASVSIDHTHNITHTHNINDHTHGLNSHTHDSSDHTHTMSNHTHTTPDHTHLMASHSHPHNHTNNTLDHAHNYAHVHGLSSASGATISLSLNTATTAASASGQNTVIQYVGTGSPIQVLAVSHTHPLTGSLGATEFTGTTAGVSTSPSGGVVSATGVTSTDSTANNSPTGGASTGNTTDPNNSPTSGASAGNTSTGPSTANTTGSGTLTTASQSTSTTSGSASTTTINAQPPVKGWYFIMKL